MIIPYVFFIYITAFGSHNTITFEEESQAACEQMHRAVMAGLNAFLGRGNFAGRITECEPKNSP